MQVAPGLGLDDTYISIADTTEARLTGYGGEPRRRWTLNLTQVDRPISGIAGSATWTVRDVAIEVPTGLELVNRYATVLDLALNNRTGA